VTASATTALLAMSFPERLVEIRKSRNLTQQGLADLAGIHLTQIQRYEKGEAQPTLDMIRKLSLALAVSADWLLFDEDERGPDDALKRQFEALRQFDDDERHVAEVVLESLILKHQAKQAILRTQPVAKRSAEPEKPTTKRRVTR
jgi:transcriptional regulator with XRE-family HTH domain